MEAFGYSVWLKPLIPLMQLVYLPESSALGPETFGQTRHFFDIRPSQKF